MYRSANSSCYRFDASVTSQAITPKSGPADSLLSSDTLFQYTV